MAGKKRRAPNAYSPNAGLIRIPADKYSSRKSHCKITTIKSDLHQCAIRHTHTEYLGESFYHRIGYVIGKSPECKTTGDENKRNKIADAVFAQDRKAFGVIHNGINSLGYKLV